MTRILCWNIERFGINKLLPNRWDVNGSRRLHILNAVGLTNILPGGLDAFIILEVQTPAGFGGLIGGAAGVPGLDNILTALRTAFPADRWAMVPPLVITPVPGYSEGIAVFYKDTTLNFVGPMAWGGVAAGAVPPPPVGPGIPYAAPWVGALPATPSVLPHGLGPAFNQDQLAGKVLFHTAAGAVIQFPDANARSIWMTQFYQKGNGRVLSLFAVHFPPQVWRSIPAFRNLVTVPEIVGPPAFGGHEDRVVIGDFNINSVNPAEAAVFQHLNGNHPAGSNSPIPYQTAFVPASQEPTTIKSVMQSSTTGVPQFYNYGTRNSALQLLGLDNIFIHRTGGAAAPQRVVINRVVGTPVVGPYYTVDMVTDIPTINDNTPNPPNPNYLPPGGPRARHFRTLVNYGHIGGARGTSDHLGVLVELP